jgi:hypothetical protein
MLALVAACSNPKRPDPVEPSDPYSFSFDDCMKHFGETPGVVSAARSRGDPLAIRCLISAGRDEGREPDFFAFYSLYRIEGVEPEGLNEMVSAKPRDELASLLRIIHGMYDYLEPFEFAWNNWFDYCTQYDEVATELLRRAKPPEKTNACLPRGYDD